MSWSINEKGSIKAVRNAVVHKKVYDDGQGDAAKEFIIEQLDKHKAPFNNFVEVEANGHSDNQNGHGSMSIRVSFGQMAKEPNYDEAEKENSSQGSN